MGQIIIDTDSHVNEPPDLWTSRMSAKKWGDLVPHVRWNDAADSEFWFVGDTPIATVGTCLMVPGPDGEPVRSPTFPQMARSYADMHPSAYDATARLAVMDRYGIQAASLYPNLGFVGPDVYAAFGTTTLEFRTEALRAYNDFLLEWASTDPDRLISLACIPYWDVDAAVAEIERAAAMGHKGLVSTGKPQEHGQPFFVDPHWDPMWAAAQETGLSISFHVAGGDVSRHMNDARIDAEGWRATLVRLTTSYFFESAIELSDLLMSGVLARYPRLRFISVESGIGWIPFLLESVDEHFKKYAPALERPEFEDGMLPSDYFHRQVYANYWFEKLEPWHLDVIGADSLLFETDYPHQTCLGPEEIAHAVEVGLGGVDDEVRQKILWRNAADLFGLQVPAAA